MLLSVLLPCAPIAPAWADAGAGSHARLDAYIRDRMEATGTPGLAYAVVAPEGTVHQRAWGTDGRGDPVTARTPFLWGSVAKPIAATSVMALVEEGVLGLDDRVVDHLPDFRFGGPEHAPQVTVRHLLHQTAGIPASAVGAVDCLDADCPPPAARIGTLDAVDPLGPPGTEYAYSSTNYLVLAAVMESATGRSYAEHVRATVFEPAGMDGAIADRASARTRGLAPGHQPLWGVPAPVADGVDDGGAVYGYTGGDLGDLAAFAAFQLRGAQTADGEAVLTSESVHLMREEGRLRPDGGGSGYGMGWRVGGLDAPLDDAVWHTGASPGYSGMLFLLPEQDRALVVQQNLYALLQDRSVMQVGFGAARILAGAEPSVDAGSAPLHRAVVWCSTALAVLMVVAAVRSLVLLRRPAGTASAWRRAVPAALVALAGALPGAAVAAVVATVGAAIPLVWVPDAWIALLVATAAGAVTVVAVIAGAARPRWRAAERAEPARVPVETGER
ncbi:serine hydrolase domain-containing protein [Nocardiopsis halophila]|uniref:serine hydrolase domain-containing protein n=1 Tax=Nocardiopsis halophila TaxID=141692 RepID=UPI00034D2A8C|nr:serine hydrolase domain-containing protein [Nocardiopsis halophila]